MKIKAIKQQGDIELDKRTYLPFEITSRCPFCKREEVMDLSDQYLSYPVIGKNEIYFFHSDADEDGVCDNEWTETVELGITLRACK